EGTGEVLIGANVYLPALKTGTASNEYGFFSLPVPIGEHQVEISYTGYNKSSFLKDFTEDLRLNFSLVFDESQLNEVVVTPEESIPEIRYPGNRMNHLSPQEIEKVPSLLGEPDVVKTLQLLPGITSLYEGASTFYVRGGNRDQNLILVDDAPVYNPSHLFGLFSAFDEHALKNVTIYKYGIPARFGGRLSSVLDLRMNDGNMQKFSVYGSLGLIAGRFSIEGPLKKDKSSFSISVRRSLFDIYFNSLAQTKMTDIYFYDISAKCNIWLNKNNRLFFTIYSGKDIYKNANTANNLEGIQWFNTLSSLRWNHIFNSKLFLNSTLLLSTYNYYLGQPNTEFLTWASSITKLGFRTDFTLFSSANNTIRFGYNMGLHDIKPGQIEQNGKLLENLPYVEKRYSLEHSFYLNNEHQVSKNLALNYGVRIPIFQNIGESTVYLFDSNYEPTDTVYYPAGKTYNTQLGFEPRVMLKFSPDKKNIFYLGYERHHQYLQLLSNLSGSLTSVEVWLPSSPNIKPQIADQISSGYLTSIKDNNVDLAIDLFYKKLNNIVDYRDHALLFLNPGIEQELRFGTGESYGLEVQLKKKAGRLTGFTSYSWSRVFHQIKGINNDKKFPALFDRPHELAFLIAYNLSTRWTFSANWVYATGSPFTSPDGFYNYQGYYVPLYSGRNNDRFPDYHRLDISFSLRSKPERKYKSNLTIAFYNLYRQHNPIAINFNKLEDKDGNLVVTNDLLNNNDLVVTQTFIYGFVPSITYSIKF
ncbi:MAG: TonB-dependent receptor, partial [Bacteroidales bacterium]|nr:TonB-dependent receptor [Bacteroidales bacterium]